MANILKGRGRAVPAFDRGLHSTLATLRPIAEGRHRGTVTASRRASRRPRRDSASRQRQAARQRERQQRATLAPVTGHHGIATSSAPASRRRAGTRASVERASVTRPIGSRRRARQRRETGQRPASPAHSRTTRRDLPGFPVPPAAPCLKLSTEIPVDFHFATPRLQICDRVLRPVGSLWRRLVKAIQETARSIAAP
jgi:hypothetical protein